MAFRRLVRLAAEKLPQSGLRATQSTSSSATAAASATHHFPGPPSLPPRIGAEARSLLAGELTSSSARNAARQLPFLAAIFASGVAMSTVAEAAGKEAPPKSPKAAAAPVQAAVEAAPPAESSTFKPTIIFVLGGPGAGKGTQCSKIVEHYGFVHLSAGDLLRAEIKSGSENGNMIADMIKEGKIVPSSVTVKLLEKAVKEAGGKRFLIDGFPRTNENREAFEKWTGWNCDFVLFFDCPEAVMEKRLLGRQEGRADDNIETIKKRFKVFVEQSLPVIDHFNTLNKVRRVMAVSSPAEVFANVKTHFDKFAVEDVLDANSTLLAAIDTKDWTTYAELCAPNITCFEPEAKGGLVEGLPFHKFYFDKAQKSAPQPVSYIIAPRVQLLAGGDVAVVTYKRLVQGPATSDVAGFEETRVWVKKGTSEAQSTGSSRWTNVHFHRSAPGV